jgi:Tol biopolymer transport system component
MTAERDLTWFDLSDLRDMSQDGGTILFTERAAGRPGSFFLRKTDGSPAVKLGEGDAFALSPDGKLVLSRPTDSPGLVLVPTGAGTPVRLERGDVQDFQDGRFFPDGRKIVFEGKLSGGNPRLYTQEIPGGKPVVFNEEGFASSGEPISPDGREIVVFRDWQEDLSILRFDGGPRRVIPNSKVLDPVRWTPDGRFIYCLETRSVPARIVKLDPATGKREPFKELSPAGAPTVLGISNPLFTPDGRHYAYGYSCAASSDLFILEGLK